MNINAALKAKNEYAGKIAKIDARLLSSNRYPKGTQPSYNTTALMNERLAHEEYLISLKAKISRATQPIFYDILLMGELKSRIKVLNQMPVNELTDESRRWRSEAAIVEYVVTIGEKQRDDIVSELEARIRTLQDEIDKFNATTEV